VTVTPVGPLGTISVVAGLLSAGLHSGIDRPGSRWAEPGPAYRPGCYAFSEVIRTSIRSRSGTALVENRAGRDGIMVIEIGGGRDSLELAGWYDSLAVWRETSTGREVPEVEGFLGGRYRGRLSPDGRYTAAAVPFVPSEVQEVADLEPVMDDFLPRLPPADLEPGREWRDTSGLAIKRAPDLDDKSGPIARYRWSWTRRITDQVETGDSVTVPLEQQVKEEGELRWSASWGPLGWTRHLAIGARVPVQGPIKRSVQSVVEQDITVVRRLSDPLCAGHSREE
jgi:hypothetical protein